jgi:hypothetical protein
VKSFKDLLVGSSWAFPIHHPFLALLLYCLGGAFCVLVLGSLFSVRPHNFESIGFSPDWSLINVYPSLHHVEGWKIDISLIRILSIIFTFAV